MCFHYIILWITSFPIIIFLELLDYIEKLKKLVEAVQEPLSKTQRNVITMRNLMDSWAKVPLLIRSNGPNSLLALDDKMDRIQKRSAYYSTL